MGEVLVRYRVMPDGPEVDLEQLQSALAGALPDIASVQSCEAKPFAFGLKALEVAIVIQDEEGNNDKVEETIRGLEAVQGLELLEMGRL